MMMSSDPSDTAAFTAASPMDDLAPGPGAGAGAGAVNGDAAAKKRSNPLVDLIETEVAYVTELTLIIKKIASAWSRHNFPPPELDTMFRNIEAIYRANRSFLKSLREIGPNPSSPKALGDLLMRWIDDLDGPYSRFCDNFFANFDNWPTVQSNARLPVLLTEVSRPPADGSAPVYSDRKRQPDEPWTLDGLFALPHTRLKYYKKLYSRLLKSTQPGRSDHRLLILANEKLDELLERSKSRVTMSLLDEGPPSTDRGSGNSFPGTSDTVDISRERLSSATSVSAGRASNSSGATGQFKSPSGSPPFLPLAGPSQQGNQQQQQGAPPLELASEPVSRSGSIPGHPQGPQSQSASTITPMMGGSRPSTSISHIEELEMRLDTSQTLDIFTMQPKACQLRMNPPELPFRRELRRSADVVIYFTPTATGQEIITRRAHIVLLTDLFLMCERVGANERASMPDPAKDMRLMYPPLGGKHVKVTDLGGVGNSLSLLIAKKETLTVMLESRETKEAWMADFDHSKDFATNLGLGLNTKNQSGPSGSSMRSMSPAASVLSSGPPSSVGPMPPLDRNDSFTSSITNSFNGSGGPPPNLPPNPFANGSRPMPGGGPGGRPSPGNGPGPGLPGGSGPPSPANGGRLPGVGPPPPRLSGAMPPPQLGSPSQGPQSYMGPPRGPGGPGGPNGFGGPAGPGGPGPGGPPMQMNPANGRLPGAVGPPPPRLPGGLPGPPSGWSASPTQSPGGGGSPYVNGKLPPPFPPPQQGGAPPPFPPPQQGGGRGGPPARIPSAPDMRSGLRAPPGANGGYTSDSAPHRSRSVTSESSVSPALPSEMMKQGLSRASTRDDFSPPSSPQQSKRELNQSSVVAAQMRCKLFLKQNHAQWKALGNARLKLYHLMPANDRQLVVENDKKRLISTLVLGDGVERVGKVGIAVELSDRGARTGIVYMLQMRSEESASGLYGLLLEGSGRAGL
ncbi:unnamed protein product [Tilletia controversa]|uniref:Uncharacterized protein n=2 Tax=Tilletia TaxID=13289 RepID=A0A9N8LC70_9BASI|nr:unnamed protein product [Tilletia laevis]CAD6923419.1 unnamed protein product [Tilletia caries]CAD6928688.1 unnamed protein product [Tilletia controversa]CAD6935227.1 unnamed protein product [Tilletia controversa]CAD6943173.1 unnamed protein product [Tilletia controversa]